MRLSDCCGAQVVRADMWDAYFCTSCMQWLEHKCPDESCEFCADRPPNAFAAVLEWQRHGELRLAGTGRECEAGPPTTPEGE